MASTTTVWPLANVSGLWTICQGERKQWQLWLCSLPSTGKAVSTRGSGAQGYAEICRGEDVLVESGLCPCFPAYYNISGFGFLDLTFLSTHSLSMPSLALHVFSSTTRFLLTRLLANQLLPCESSLTVTYHPFTSHCPPVPLANLL